MDSKETIINATILLINEKGTNLDEITMRDICQKAGVGLGLINYHFRSKDNLIEVCVERIVNGIVEAFRSIREQAETLSPRERLERLGEITLNYLFEHRAISKISMLTDMRSPKENDNTHRTYQAYIPLVSACRPDWSDETVKRKTFILISTMQQIFLRSDYLLQTQGVDLTDEKDRNELHKLIIKDILEA